MIGSAGSALAPGDSGLWTHRHTSAAYEAQTRAPNPGSLDAEGGGTVTPTLGGGFGFSREQEAAAGLRERRRA